MITHNIVKISTYLSLCLSISSTQLYAVDGISFSRADELMSQKAMELFSPYVDGDTFQNIDTTKLKCLFAPAQSQEDFFNLNGSDFSYMACVTQDPEPYQLLLFAFSNMFSQKSPKLIEDFKKSAILQEMRQDIKDFSNSDELPCTEITPVGILFHFNNCS